MNPGRRGPQPYTDEPTKKATAAMLEEVLRAVKVDAATHDLTAQAIQVELSREYLDPAVRARVLRRVYERLGREWPG